MKKAYNTYKKSGVNMATVDKLVNYISKISRKTYKMFIYQKKKPISVFALSVLSEP